MLITLMPELVPISFRYGIYVVVIVLRLRTIMPAALALCPSIFVVVVVV